MRWLGDCEISPVDNGEASYSNGALDMIFDLPHHEVSLSLHEVRDNSCSGRVAAILSLSSNFLYLRHGDRLMAGSIMTIFRGENERKINV